MSTAQGAIEAGRNALQRHAWAEAFAQLKEASVAGELDAEALESLADAAWWTAHPRDSIDARERAYNAYLAAGQKRRAAIAAIWLARDNANRRSFAVAEAWLNRAEKAIAGDEECAEFGYVLFMRAMVADRGDQTVALGRRVSELGARFGDRDLQAYGAVVQGMGLITQGDVAAGLACYDEATVAAVAGELGIWSTGFVYCNTISTCRDLRDVRRASDWTEATTRWCERQSINGFPGICRVHRAEIMSLRGAWAQAEQEARRACDELLRYGISDIVAQGYYEIGEIRLNMGDLTAAEQAFRQAHEMGMTPEPGLSLIRLAEGDADAAATSLRRALANESGRPGRARLLPAEVEVALAIGDLDRARSASNELDAIARQFGTQAMVAIAGSARAAVELAEGRGADAEKTVRAALRQWQELDAPYEVARARVLLAAVCRSEGDSAAATLELEAARAAFERLGARRDARRAVELLGREAIVRGPAEATPDRATKTFLFTDIVRSTKLVEALGDDAWQDLIRWHDQTLRSLVAEHRGEEIRHQGDGLVVSFASAADAVECAVAIQRRLAEHRRAHGFAPQVRIGMHTSEAHRRGLDYAGYGIHEAARVASAAAAGEILVSAATLESSGTRYPGETRTLTLKDLPEPMVVAAIDWR